MPQQVFISYASADKAIAERVCGALESAGVSCWIAPRNITPGTDFPTAIVDAIHSVQAFVLILTDRSAASPHVLSEVGHAFNGKKRIIPFRISQAALPEDLEYFLSLTQWLDVPEGGTDQSLRRLVDATSAALAGGRIEPTPVQSKKIRWQFAAAGLLVLVIVAIAFWSLRGPPSVTPIPVPKPIPKPPRPDNHPVSEGPRTKLNPVDGLNYVWIPPGQFMMGCSAQDTACKDDEKPPHEVAIEKGFWLGQTEVTVAAYKKLGKSVPAPFNDSALPVTGVSWADAMQYCKATGGRLPTEAEWEYAARGENPAPYYGVVPQIAWYAANSGDSPHPVGKKRPNDFGLYDMLGNAAEWVLDRYFNQYTVDSAATGPDVEKPLASNAFATARGGFWGSDANGIRVSRRLAEETDGQIPTGFRCAQDQF